MQPTKSILVMWSGGIDSTYRLAKILKETRHLVFVHHIYLKNVEARHAMEARAIEKLLPLLKSIRPFNFTWNWHDDSQMPTMVYDMARVCFEAGAVSKAFYHWIKPISIDLWTIGTHKDEGHWWERWTEILPATRSAEWSPGREKFIEFELGDMPTKKKEIIYLKNLGLFEDAWYCRTPKNQQPCTTCKTCREVTEAIGEKTNAK